MSRQEIKGPSLNYRHPPAEPLSQVANLIIVGSLYTKHATIDQSIPQKMVSVVTMSGHSGTYVQVVFDELVGNKALEIYAEEEYLSIGFPYDKSDPLKDYLDHAEHIVMNIIYGSPDFRYFSVPDQVAPFYFVGNTSYSLAYGFTESATLLSLNTTFYGIDSGFVVDFGHFETRIYAISEGVVNDKMTTIGGDDLNRFLYKLILENNGKLEEKHNEIKFRKDHLSQMIGFIKEKECKVALNLEETFKKEGIVSCTADITALTADNECYLSLLPNELIGIIKKMHYEALPKRTTLEKLGYLPNKNETVIKGQTVATSYEINTPEIYLTMETLFHPKIMGLPQKGIVEQLRDFMAKNPSIKNTITFCGGAVSCPGFSERIQHELKDLTIHIDEHFLFSNVLKSIKNST